MTLVGVKRELELPRGYLVCDVFEEIARYRRRNDCIGITVKHLQKVAAHHTDVSPIRL